MGGQVLLAGSDNISGLSGDKGTVGVGHESGESSGVDGGGDWGNWESVSGEVVGLGGKDCGLVSGDNGAVGVSHQGGGVGVGTPGVVVVAVPGTVVDAVLSGVGEGTGVASPCGGDDALGGKVGGLSGEDIRGLGWGDGAVGVGHQLGR